MEEIHLASQDALNGLPSRRPVIEMTIPSSVDKTISPPGTDHLHDIFNVSSDLLQAFLLNSTRSVIVYVNHAAFCIKK